MSLGCRRDSRAVRVLFVHVLIWCVLYAGMAAGDRKDVPVVREVGTVAARLEAAASACERLSLDSLGEVAYGTFHAPLWVAVFQPAEKAGSRVLLTGGVHGNEPAGCEAMLRFIELLAASPGRYPSIAFDIIPLANPWGWAHDKRHNGKRVDLNRDFASFNACESSMIHGFTRARRYDLIVDLHEDGTAKGFYLYQIDNEEDALCNSIIARQKALGYSAEQNARMVILKTKDGIIDVPRWTLNAVQFARQLSMTNYFRLTKCERVFLFETPKRMPMEDRLIMHRAGLEALLGSVGGIGRVR